MKSSFGLRILAALACTVSMSAPSSAQEAPAPDPAIVQMNAESARLEAQAKLRTAEAALLQAKLAPLTALKTESKAELGEKGGAMEASILSSHALSEAALRLVGRAKLGSDAQITGLLSTPAPSRYLVLAAGETIQTDTYFAVSYALFGVSRQLVDACALPESTCVEPDDQMAGGGPIATISAVASVLGMLGGEVKLSGVDSGTSSQMLARKVAQHLGGKAYLSDTILFPDLEKVPLQADLQKMFKLRKKANSAVVRLGRIAKPNPSQKAAKEALDAAVKRHDDYIAKITAADDKGVVTLATALRQSNLFVGDYRLLRLSVEKAGGSTITRKNLGVVAGAVPAIGISGGLIISWDESDPKTGQVFSAGTLTCITDFARVRRIQRGLTRAPVCL